MTLMLKRHPMQQNSHCFKEGDCYTNHQGEEDLSMENKNQRICIIGGGCRHEHGYVPGEKGL